MNILCLGDSIMQYNDWTSYPQTGWVQLLDRFFERDVKILNFARNGRSSKSFIAEGRFDEVLKVAVKGDFALIQFAHNDEKIKDSTRYTSAERGGEFRKNLIFFAEELQKKGCMPIFLTPVTRRSFLDEHTIENTHSSYQTAIIETANELNLPFVDLTGLSMSFFESLGKTKSRNFFMNFDAGLYQNYPEGKNDDSHLRSDGAYAICKLFVSDVLKNKDKFSDFKILSEKICLRGIYCDREIDDEKLMWK
ncbi:rhamnogalacturonan acetylesterase [Treponema pectinovorum]|uniref:rhamnogalacturonan acetylesterase n=1 Tax=Treponema pectinovorum TaxID=164 RepID=UPI0011C90A8F|nr:rhamnogalacturonan acetylesterase [Treponema pectinovorum]